VHAASRQAVNPERGNRGGCATLIAVVLVVGAVVAAGISLAALVDPFDRMPPVGAIWADCEDARKTARDDCDLAVRFPGFWSHAIANLAYVLAATLLVLALAAAIADLREQRAARFASRKAADTYVATRRTVVVIAGLTAVVAALPIAIAAL